MNLQGRTFFSLPWTKDWTNNFLLSSFVYLVLLGHSVSNNVVLKSSSVMRHKMWRGWDNSTLYFALAQDFVSYPFSSDHKPEDSLRAAASFRALSATWVCFYSSFSLKKIFLFKYTWFTMLCSFLLYSKVTQLYIYIVCFSSLFDASEIYPSFPSNKAMHLKTGLSIFHTAGYVAAGFQDVEFTLLAQMEELQFIITFSSGFAFRILM